MGQKRDPSLKDNMIKMLTNNFQIEYDEALKLFNLHIDLIRRRAGKQTLKITAYEIACSEELKRR